jgi:hypothetical protein
MISVKCANGGCDKMVHIVPFGNYYGESMKVKVNCRECYIPLVDAPILERRVEEHVGEAFHENWDEETVVE